MKPKPATPIITLDDVTHVAQLANLPVTPAKLTLFQQQLSSILEYVRLVQQADTASVTETAQTTGLTNVFREDVVDSSRTFTQVQALANAKQTHDGYIVAPTVFEDN